MPITEARVNQTDECRHSVPEQNFLTAGDAHTSWRWRGPEALMRIFRFGELESLNPGYRAGVMSNDIRKARGL